MRLSEEKLFSIIEKGLRQSGEKSVGRSIDYDIAMTRIAKKLVAKYPNAQWERVLERCCLDASDSHVSFAAFYILTICFRRVKDFTLLKAAFDNYAYKFSNDFDYRFLYLSYRAENPCDKYPDYEVLLKDADRLISANKYRASCLHIYCELVASICEEGIDLSRSRLFSALHHLDNAIDLFPYYPKYYATKGRIQALLGDWDSAEHSFDQAFLQTYTYPSDSDLLRYQIEEMRMSSKIAFVSQSIGNSIKQAEEKLETVNGKLKDLNSQSIEIIALFSAVISIVLTIGYGSINKNASISTISVAASLESGLLLILLAGVHFLQSRSCLKCLIIGIVGVMLFLPSFVLTILTS